MVQMEQGRKLDQLRDHVMSADGLEEKVEVNQRHLIDKILARYSAEHVVYRELMQNADDASAQGVQILFTTDSPVKTEEPNLKGKCTRLIIKNNGMPFRPEDWARLKSIAEGNPDEQKIGAFGVGFYSLFSICENPFVSSGQHCMGFFFKGDQLYTRRGQIQDEDVTPWTSILMDMRQPITIPEMTGFAKFLTCSLGFTANLREISVFVDDHRVFHILKRTDEPRPMAIDHKQIFTSSVPDGIFTLGSVSIQKVQLEVERFVPPTFTSSLMSAFMPKALLGVNTEANSAPLTFEKASTFLRVVTGVLKVSVSKELEREMERSTKKKPPKQTNFQLVFTGREELDVSENTNIVFQDLVPYPEQGRIYIGFPTHQTTGCCSHMAARFIPTVERESIDFADRYIGKWNRELLVMGGLLCRVVYNDEMDQIRKLYKELVGNEELVDNEKLLEEDKTSGTDITPRTWLRRRAFHALQSFTFKPSTPSSIVSQDQGFYFYEMARSEMHVMTSHGIQSLIRTRSLSSEDPGTAASELINKFIKSIPLVSISPYATADAPLQKLKAEKKLKPFGIRDVFQELESRSLTIEEMIICMKWWITLCESASSGYTNAETKELLSLPQTRQNFLRTAIFTYKDGTPMQLAAVTSFINPKLIPVDMPLPQNVLPFEISCQFQHAALKTYFGWSELQVIDWVRHVFTNPELETSPKFAEKVLSVVSKSLSTQTKPNQDIIINLLKEKRCIPTKRGMKLPTEAYFPTVKLFEDLPIMILEHPRGISEAMLLSLGVRKHVELQLIFDRLVSQGNWSHIELVKYLASVQNMLSTKELHRLQETAIFPKVEEVAKEDTPVNGKTIKEADTKEAASEAPPLKSAPQRYRAKELYAPLAELKNLKLPTIRWDSKWKPASEEAKFLEVLGLRNYPTLAILLNQASNPNNSQADRNQSLKYFIDNFDKYYREFYNPMAATEAFIPCRDGRYSKPSECFGNAEASVLGFKVIHTELSAVRDKLGVREDPDSPQLLKAFLANIQTDPEKAKNVFNYMASRISLGQSTWNQLQDVEFIPVKDSRTTAKGANTITLMRPTECYFLSKDAQNDFHKELFVFIDFGDVANTFLRCCGVKNEPTTLELAQMMVRNPQLYWKLSGGGENYLNVLRQIANQFYQIKRNRPLIDKMRTAKILVGYRQLEPDGSKTSDKTATFEYCLVSANSVYINDDANGYHLFSPICAPMDPVIEELYKELGCVKLSTQIREASSYVGPVQITPRSADIQSQVVERIPIILYQVFVDAPQRKSELRMSQDKIVKKLQVVEATKINITRTFLPTGQKNVQWTSSCGDVNECKLYIGGNKEIDYYDVAASLCHILFRRIGFNDAIIFERYLVASLDNLRSRGVPVDRILNTPKVTKPAAENFSQSIGEAEVEDTKSSKQLDEHTKKVQDVFPDCDPNFIRSELQKEKQDHVANVVNKLLSTPYPKNTNPAPPAPPEFQKPNGQIQKPETHTKPPVRKLESIGTNFFNKFTRSRTKTEQEDAGSRKPTEHQETRPPPSGGNAVPPTPHGTKPNSPNPVMGDIKNHQQVMKRQLEQAISACQSNSAQNVFSPPTMHNVQEYCDATSGQNLKYVAKAKGYEFYVHNDVDGPAVLEQYEAQLGHFSSVIGVLVGVFNIDALAIHIFYDTTGNTIAFYRNGSLFFNLRFYLNLHDAPSAAPDSQVRRTKRRDALKFWYMTMCHELAHCFEARHNAQHEYYVESFAEMYLDTFIDKLAAFPAS